MLKLNKTIKNIVLLLLLTITTPIRPLNQKSLQQWSVGTGAAVSIGASCLAHLINKNVHVGYKIPIGLAAGAITGALTYGLLNPLTDEYKEEKKREQFINACQNVKQMYEEAKKTISTINDPLPDNVIDIETHAKNNYITAWPLVSAHDTAQWLKDTLKESSNQLDTAKREITHLIKTSQTCDSLNNQETKAQLQELHEACSREQNKIPELLKNINNYAEQLIKHKNYSIQSTMYHRHIAEERLRQLEHENELAKIKLHQREQEKQRNHDRDIAAIYEKTVEKEVNKFTAAFELEKAHLKSRINDLTQQLSIKNNQVSSLQNSIKQLEKQAASKTDSQPAAPTTNNAAYEDCSICLEQVTPGPSALKTTCGHLFHQACIKDWKQSNNANKDKCPNCRAKLQ